METPSFPVLQRKSNWSVSKLPCALRPKPQTLRIRPCIVAFGSVHCTINTEAKRSNMDVDAVQPVGDTDTDIGNMDDILAETEIRLEEVIGSDLASLSDGNESPICTTVEKNESSSELDASEKENYERFCAFAEQIAPNKSIWEDVYHLRTTPFSQDELPFQQKTFMFGLQPQHILAIPFLKSAGTLLLSTFTLFVLVVNYHTANVEHYRASRLIFSSTLIVTPLLGIGWIPYLYEHPCRLLLYYRLWEHKS